MANKRSTENRKKKDSAKKKCKELSSYEAQRRLELQSHEDQIDLEDARAALADVETNGTIAWEKIKAELKL